jgi:ribosome-binding ATPase YchF (GTP1/OBG family)
VSLEIGIVGLPGSGKSTLFNALTHAHAGAGYADRPHVGMAQIPDERLDTVARIIGSAKSTPAAIRVLDAPGTGPALLGNLRRADALLAVLDAFSPGADPERDLEALQLELLVADRDHVEKRLETVQRQAKSGDPALRREVSDLEQVLAHLEAEQPLSAYEAELPPELQPLTTKPLLAIQNGPGGIDAKFEAELAELPEEEASDFRDDAGISALDEVVARLRDALGLLAFFTANESEARAWTLRSGESALDAAAAIHSDIAHGFVRCEVIRFDDLLESGSRSEAARRGVQRLEGKAYVVQDGDLLQIRFTPPR